MNLYKIELKNHNWTEWMIVNIEHHLSKVLLIIIIIKNEFHKLGAFFDYKEINLEEIT